MVTLTEERLGEIALAIIKQDIGLEIGQNPLTPVSAKNIIGEIVERTNPNEVAATREELLAFCLHLMPDENSKTLFSQVIEKSAGLDISPR